MKILQTKCLEQLQAEAKAVPLKKTLSAVDLILLGIGIIIGTGIFVLTGVAAAKYAGPSIMISFVMAAVTCVFVCLAYAELAAMIPMAGSAYTYTYTALGELMAWLVGWNLILEYTIGASAVAGGWSAYVVGLLQSAGIVIPKALTTVPSEGGLVNLPAVLITLFLSGLLVLGIKESARVNRILVAVKIGAIFVFLLLAGGKVDVTNWEPFMPFGFSGISAGAAVIFFAYLGFDSVATAAEETVNPKRDMPIGIIGSLAVCTVLYIAVTAVMTGAVPYTELNNAEPVAYVLRKLGYNFGSALVGTGAICGLSTVLLVMIYAQTRSFFAMSRDGLIPSGICKLHPKYQTPHVITLLVGLAIALISGFTPIHVVAEMCSIGTLFAYLVSTIGVVALRLRRPDAERPFRCPQVYLVCTLGIICCGYIMANLAVETWWRFAAWSLVGIGIYFVYGVKHSLLRQGAASEVRKLG